MRWLRNIFRDGHSNVDVEALRRFSDSRWPKEMGRTHGVEHWDRVARFGQLLYKEGADLDVILAFAYLHDSERMNNGHDIDHGKRASCLIDTIRHTKLQDMTDEQIAKLKKACELHTITHRTGDLTIDICFDADRMDLPRVGITPLPQRMATPQGAELVANPHYEDFYRKIVRETNNKTIATMTSGTKWGLGCLVVCILLGVGLVGFIFLAFNERAEFESNPEKRRALFDTPDKIEKLSGLRLPDFEVLEYKMGETMITGDAIDTLVVAFQDVTPDSLYHLLSNAAGWYTMSDSLTFQYANTEKRYTVDILLEDSSTHAEILHARW